MTQLQNRTLRWGPFDGREVQSVEFPNIIWVHWKFVVVEGATVPFNRKWVQGAHCYCWDYDRQEFVFSPVALRMKRAQ